MTLTMTVNSIRFPVREYSFQKKMIITAYFFPFKLRSSFVFFLLCKRVFVIQRSVGENVYFVEQSELMMHTHYNILEHYFFPLCIRKKRSVKQSSVVEDVIMFVFR